MQLALKAVRLITTRPAQILSTFRGYFLFQRTRAIYLILLRKNQSLQLGKNVRIQRLSCLSAERPSAIISVGEHSVIYENARLEAYGLGQINLGERSIVGDVRIYSRNRISIGKRAVFSWNVFIQDFHSHPTDPSLRARQLVSMTDHFLPAFDGYKPTESRMDWPFPSEPIELGDDIWFGANCTILPGVRIGSGSIVAAGAVVTRGEYPSGSILAGNPARVVKTLPVNGK